MEVQIGQKIQAKRSPIPDQEAIGQWQYILERGNQFSAM